MRFQQPEDRQDAKGDAGYNCPHPAEQGEAGNDNAGNKHSRKYGNEGLLEAYGE